MPENPTENLSGLTWLIQEWVARLGTAIESMTGERPELSWEPAAPANAPLEGLLWWRQEFSHAPEIPLWIGSSRESWETIGGQVLHAAGLDDAGPEDLKSTYQEVLSQSFAGLANAFSARLRREITCTESRLESPAINGQIATYSVSGTFGEKTAILTVVLSPELGRSLEVSTGVSASTAPSISNEPSTALAAEAAAKSLDLLLDVELPVSVSFGRAQLPLKDVVKLTTGSIVELNRSVSEPVEIIVNNCVIARGQVVVIEGNFGVRVQQVISRQERLRTLK